MTTEKLIINGVDHGVFNLEWAKRGGWCIADDSNVNFQQKMLGKMINNTFFSIKMFTKDAWFDINSYGIDRTLRMATPAECEAAGVEYIKRPVSDQSLLDLQRRTQAALRYAEKLRGIFHVSMLKAYPQKSHQEISVEINNAMKEVK